MKHVSYRMVFLATLLIVFLFLYTPLTYTVSAANETSPPSNIPKVTNVIQIAPDTLKVTYDRKMDLNKAIDPNHYWVQDLCNENPAGIASLGKNALICSTNTLAQSFATIIPTDSSNSCFLIKFSDFLISGANYRLIVCFLTMPDANDYTGENGRFDFTGK